MSVRGPSDKQGGGGEGANMNEARTHLIHLLLFIVAPSCCLLLPEDPSSFNHVIGW